MAGDDGSGRHAVGCDVAHEGVLAIVRRDTGEYTWFTTENQRVLRRTLRLDSVGTFPYGRNVADLLVENPLQLRLGMRDRFAAVHSTGTNEYWAAFRNCHTHSAAIVKPFR